MRYHPSRFFAGTAMAVLVAFAFSGCSQEGKKTRYVSKADEYFTAGDYDKAEIEYKNALQMGGLDPRAVGQLGIIYFDQGRLRKAGGFLLKGTELQPDNLDLKLKLGYFFLTIGKPKDALAIAILVMDHRPQDPEAPILLAETVTQPAELADARQRLDKLAASKPTAAVLIATGILDFRERKFTSAEANFDRARQLEPKSPYLHSALGRLYWTKNDRPRAEKEFMEAAENAPARSPIRLQIAQFSAQNGHPDAARKMLEEMVQKTPDFLPPYVLLANLLIAEKKADEGLVLLDKVLTRDPEHPEVLLLSAQTRMAKGEKEKALAILEKATSAYPESSEFMYHLGLAHLANGDLGKATSSFSQSITISLKVMPPPGYPPAVIALAELNVRQKSFAPAIDSLRKLIQQNPRIIDARLVLANALRGQGNLDDALSAYQDVLKFAPNNAQALYQSGLVLQQQKKKAEARQAFTKTLDASPDYLPALERLVDMDLADKQSGAAQARIEAYVAKRPNDATSYIMLAKVLLDLGKKDEAEAALQKAVTLQPDSPVAYFLLAQIYISTKQVPKALAQLQDAAAKSPKDATLLMQLGALNEQQKNYAAARDNYEKALALNPKIGGALNNLAYLYTERLGDLDKAYDAAQKARELMPNQPETADTLGWILYKKRQYSRALALLTENTDKLQDNAEAQYHLGMARYTMGDEAGAHQALKKALGLASDFSGVEDARQSLEVLEIDPAKVSPSSRQLLEKAVARQKDDLVALSRLAVLYEIENKPEQAIAAYEAVLKANPGYVNGAVKLIRLYRARNETSKALDLAKATRKIAPGDADLAHILGRLSYENKEYASAFSLLQEAALKNGRDPELSYDLAEAAYSVGRLAIAETAARDAMTQSTGSPRAAKNRQFLDLLNAAQDPAKSNITVAEVDALLKSDPNFVPAVMAKAAFDDAKGDWKSAATGYEKALTRFPDFAPAKKSLAILYSKPSTSVEPQKALEAATKARDAFPTDAEVAKALGMVLYNQKNFSRAVAVLQEAARTRNTDPDVMYYLGMAQRQLKDNSAGNRSLQRALELGLSGALEADAKRAIASSK